MALLDSTIKLVSFNESTNIFYETKQLSFYQGKAILIAILFKSVCFSIFYNVKLRLGQLVEQLTSHPKFEGSTQVTTGTWTKLKIKILENYHLCM